MKKVIAMFLTVTLVLSMAACGSGEKIAPSASEDKSKASEPQKTKDFIPDVEPEVTDEPEVVDIPEIDEPSVQPDIIEVPTEGISEEYAKLLYDGYFSMIYTQEEEGLTLSYYAETDSRGYAYMAIDMGEYGNFIMATEGDDTYIIQDGIAYKLPESESENVSANIDIDTTLRIDLMAFVENVDGYDVYDITEDEGSSSVRLYVNPQTKSVERIETEGQVFHVSALHEKSFDSATFPDIKEATEEEAAELIFGIFGAMMGGAVSQEE